MQIVKNTTILFDPFLVVCGYVNFCIIFFLLTFVDINQKNYKIFCCKNNYL